VKLQAMESYCRGPATIRYRTAVLKTGNQVRLGMVAILAEFNRRQGHLNIGRFGPYNTAHWCNVTRTLQTCYEMSFLRC
jgi:hypothetical protein